MILLWLATFLVITALGIGLLIWLALAEAAENE